MFITITEYLLKPFKWRFFYTETTLITDKFSYLSFGVRANYLRLPP